MRILVTGSGGMLARDLVPVLSEQGHDVIGLVKQELDITDAKAVVNSIEKVTPDMVINCAAYSAVDSAESEQGSAFLLNGFAVQNLCLACQRYNIALVHFSTDYVFDGKKQRPYSIYDQPNPINTYGRSKLLGEKYVIWLLTRFFLIRTSWLFGLYGRNFVKTMLECGRSNEPVYVVDDQRGCPTWTQHLAQAVADLIVTHRYGIYHITNSDCTTWYDFAKEIFRLAKVNVEIIRSSSQEMKRPALRPHNSVLDDYPLAQVLGRGMPTWQEALEQYLAEHQRSFRGIGRIALREGSSNFEGCAPDN